MGCYLSLWLCGPYFTYPLKQPYSWPLSQPERLETSWHLVVLKSLVKVAFWILNLDCLRELRFQCLFLRSHPSSEDWHRHLHGLSLDGYLPFGRLQLFSTMEVVLGLKLQDPLDSWCIPSALFSLNRNLLIESGMLSEDVNGKYSFCEKVSQSSSWNGHWNLFLNVPGDVTCQMYVRVV